MFDNDNLWHNGFGPIIEKGGLRMQRIAENGMLRVEPCANCGNVIPGWCQAACDRMRAKVANAPQSNWFECNFCGDTLVPLAEGENDICVDCAEWLSNWEQVD